MLKYVIENFMSENGEATSMEQKLDNFRMGNNGLFLVMVILFLLVQLYVIQLLWNNVMVKVTKHSKITLWQALGLKVLVSFLVG